MKLSHVSIRQRFVALLALFLLGFLVTGFWSMLTRVSPINNNPVPGPWSAQRAARVLVTEQADQGKRKRACVRVTPLSKLEMTTEDLSADF